MALYRCNVCKVFEYDIVLGSSPTGIKPGTLPKEFPESWRCPRCKADKTHLELLDYGKDSAITIYSEEESLPFSRERHEFRHGTEPEEYVSDIHTMASTGRSLIEPMRTKKSVVSWDDILIMGAQIAKIPLNEDILVNTTTVIGPNAKRPLVIETPLFVTHMSFGALSRETKIALAMGTAAVKTAIGSGEGGILDEERKYAYRYIFEYVPNRYSVTDENLAMVDAIEIKLGQSAEPGLGARLPREKVTPEIARVRGYPEGKDIISPASYPDIQNQNDLKRKIEWLQSQSGGRPVGVKIAAGNVEKDLVALLYARPDFITIDGRPGATGAAPKYIKAATSVPTIFALYRARTYLDERGVKDISLIITGGLRISPDFAKALALGADAIALGTGALIACGCQQHRICNSGVCPVGITTQRPELRKRMHIDESAKRLENYLRVCTDELKSFARLTGNNDVHTMNIQDLCTTNSEISNHTGIRHV